MNKNNKLQLTAFFLLKKKTTKKQKKKNPNSKPALYHPTLLKTLLSSANPSLPIYAPAALQPQLLLFMRLINTSYKVQHVTFLCLLVGLWSAEVGR